MTNNRMTRPPLLLENFESARTSAEGSGRRWGSKGEKTYASVEIVDKQSHPDIIRSGNHALKFDYDFRYETTEGGSRRAYYNTYAGENDYPASENIKDDPNVLVIPEGEYPTHLAMWVYGDANDAWFNGMIVDSDGKEVDITCGDLEWIGWKFITMDIPPKFKLPFYVAYAARLLTGNQTIHGTMYVDDIMAVYGGIDFDVVPPLVSQIRCSEQSDGQPGLPVISALFADEDDNENGCVASGVNPDRTEVSIDGVPHKNSIHFEPSGKAFRMELTPDFPLCGGTHKLEIVAFDHAGNSTRTQLFFDIASRTPGVCWSVDQSVEFGGPLRCHLTMDGAKKDIKTTITLKYDNEMLVPAENFFTPGTGVSGTIKDDQGLLNINLDCGDNTGSVELATLDFTAVSALDGAQDTAIICEAAQLESNGKTEKFCLADAGIAIIPGLCLLVERLCKGYDTVFTVTDSAGLPVAGAKVCESQGDTVYPGVTDAEGRLTVAGISSIDVGSKMVFFARKDNRFSVSKRYMLSNDLGTRYPVNINVNCGKNVTEVGVTWQTGVGITEGAIRYALKTPDKTDLTADDQVKKADRANSFSTYQKESCEMNGYSVCLTGVEPDAEYLYQVGTGNFWSETKVLKTMPAGSDFVFAVLADTHNHCGKAMRAAIKSEPDIAFFAHMGDFVSAGGVYDDWLNYSKDAEGLQAVYPKVSVAGNHDLSDGTGANYRLVHNNPTNGVAGAPKGLYYYTELNNTLFVCLGGGFGDDKAIMAWVDEILRNTKMKWKIVMTHEGPYTCYINSAAEEIKWGEYFGNTSIDMLISGHDHTYQRATIKDHQTLDVKEHVSSADGVTYLQCATSGGASHHDWAQHRPIWNAVYDSMTPSATILHVTDEKIQVKVQRATDDAEGFEVYDRFELTK